MSKYEVISKCISDFSLLMQSVEKIYKIFKRYFIKPNKGVNKVLNTNVVIKDMHIKTCRLKDESVLNLIIDSPFRQKDAENYMYSQEQVYSFQIDQNKEVTVFVEYTDPYNSVRAEVNEYELELYIDYEDKCETYLCIGRLHCT